MPPADAVGKDYNTIVFDETNKARTKVTQKTTQKLPKRLPFHSLSFSPLVFSVSYYNHPILEGTFRPYCYLKALHTFQVGYIIIQACPTL